MYPNRMINKAARHIAEHRSEGDLLMDVQLKLSWSELRELAKNRSVWRTRVLDLRKNATFSTSTYTVNIA